MSQPNDLDEIGLKTKGKKSKGILYYFQPWKWKKKAVVEVESDVKQKSIGEVKVEELKGTITDQNIVVNQSML